LIDLRFVLLLKTFLLLLKKIISSVLHFANLRLIKMIIVVILLHFIDILLSLSHKHFLWLLNILNLLHLIFWLDQNFWSLLILKLLVLVLLVLLMMTNFWLIIILLICSRIQRTVSLSFWALFISFFLSFTHIKHVLLVKFVTFNVIAL